MRPTEEQCHAGMVLAWCWLGALALLAVWALVRAIGGGQ